MQLLMQKVEITLEINILCKCSYICNKTSTINILTRKSEDVQCKILDIACLKYE